MRRIDRLAAPETEEFIQSSRLLSRIHFVSLAAYIVVMISGLLWNDWRVIIATAVSAALLVIPYCMLRQGYLQVSGVLMVLILLVNVTLLATIGQGIHDVAIMAYPIIILFASLAMNRSSFILCVLLTLVSIGWLVFGESIGMFTSESFEMPGWIDFMVMSMLLLVTALAVDILSANIRRNLVRAQSEIEQRKKIEELLRDQGTHDTLTGLYNRNFYEEEQARLERGRNFPISIIVADVNGLKTVNDTLGHIAGDAMLRQIADVLRSVFRADDILARIGGDEYAALLPATDASTAEQILGRVNERLNEYNTLHPESRLRLSVGAATAEVNNLAATFALADQRMYADKAARKSM
jgi:diguanylate cyclase (GGDEF)-like protein